MESIKIMCMFVHLLVIYFNYDSSSTINTYCLMNDFVELLYTHLRLPIRHENVRSTFVLQRIVPQPSAVADKMHAHSVGHFVRLRHHTLSTKVT